MQFHLITLFPESFSSYLEASIIGRAIDNKKIKVHYYNPRDVVKDKNRRIDQKPYGGGPGMVIEALPIIKTIDKILKKISNRNREYSKNDTLIIWLSPSGKQFDNNMSEKLSKKYKDIIIICGRYEGIDERVRKVFKTTELSIGPYVLTGGELPAMVILDSITRRIPGVIGNIESLEENRISSFKVYTRPEILKYNKKSYKVPKVLLSGNHKMIEDWKQKQKHHG